jgi:Sulfotransferase family
MTREAAPRFVFVLGTGRCGSSLVHEILAQHEDVGFLSNVDDRLPIPVSLGRWNGPLFRRLPLALAEKGRVRFAPSEGYRILEREVSPVISRPVRDLVASDAFPWLGSRFGRFFERRGAAQAGAVFLHKFTGWPRARFIDAALPDARFIHVIRDGRAVANSLLQMPWWRGYGGPAEWGWGPLPEAYGSAWNDSGRSFPVLAGLEWKILMDAFAEAKAAIDPERWVDVRYEDLLRDPTTTTKELMDFVGLTWTAQFEERFRRYRFHTSRADAFRRDLGAPDVAAIENVLASHLQELGYSLPPSGGRTT